MRSRYDGSEDLGGTMGKGNVESISKAQGVSLELRQELSIELIDSDIIIKTTLELWKSWC